MSPRRVALTSEGELRSLSRSASSTAFVRVSVQVRVRVRARVRVRVRVGVSSASSSALEAGAAGACFEASPPLPYLTLASPLPVLPTLEAGSMVMGVMNVRLTDMASLTTVTWLGLELE